MEVNEIERCDDPYQYGCMREAVWKRDRNASDKPDAPMALCQDCFDAMNFTPEELERWE